MAMSRGDYRQQLMLLLPPGLLDTEPGSDLYALVDALAAEYARIDGRIDDLIAELDPRTTYELLSDWERMCNLPDACSPLNQTTEERRNAVMTKITERGGQSAAYFVSVAASLGYNITVQEHAERRFGAPLGGSFAGVAWLFWWSVISPIYNTRRRKFGSPLGERFSSWGDANFECVIKSDAPAHTTVRFVYQ